MRTRVMRCSGLSIMLMLCVMAFGSCGNDDTSNFSSEGTVADPIDVGPAPVIGSGTVGMGGDSYFVSAAGAGDWQVAISNITGKPDLYVYGNAAYSPPIACQSENPNAEPDSCVMPCSDPCGIYIRVAGAPDAGASFNLLVAEDVPVSRHGGRDGLP